MKIPLIVASLAPLSTAKTNYNGCASITGALNIRPEHGFGYSYETTTCYVSDSLGTCRRADCADGRVPLPKVPVCSLDSGIKTVAPSPSVGAAGPNEKRSVVIGSAVTSNSARLIRPRASFNEEQKHEGKVSSNFLGPLKTSDFEASPNPIHYASLDASDDEETSVIPTFTTSNFSSFFTRVPSKTHIFTPGHIAMAANAPDKRAMTVFPKNAPGPDTKPTAMALAINLMTGVAVLMAML